LLFCCAEVSVELYSLALLKSNQKKYVMHYPSGCCTLEVVEERFSDMIVKHRQRMRTHTHTHTHTHTEYI